MSQADYYQNGNHSACDTINSPLSTINYQLNRLPVQGDSGEQLFCNKNRNLKCNEYSK
ncbi:MAG: hypothetical protein LBE12_13495 [Planctomycetaceae bacterium]|nr:hypothetical protein [Planctomycetaceae bacterium]